METIYLNGSEQVSRAGHEISAAAESMRQTAGYIDESLRSFLERFEHLVERLEAIGGQ